MSKTVEEKLTLIPTKEELEQLLEKGNELAKKAEERFRPVRTVTREMLDLVLEEE